MIIKKTCSSCEHFPNDHHCIGCVWDADKQENTKWELEKNPIVIERAVLDKIRAEIEQEYKVESEHPYGQGLRRAIEIIDKYIAEGSDKE